MTVWPDDHGEWEWVDRAPDNEVRRAYEALFRSFYENPLGSPEHPHIMRFSSKTQDYFREWMQVIHKKVKSEIYSSALESHILKIPKTIASLSLIFELVTGGSAKIEVVSLEKALRWEKYLLSHAKRLYASGNMFIEENARLILKRRTKLPCVFTLWDIHQRGWSNLVKHEDVQHALELLYHFNIIREKPDTKTLMNGRPSVYYEWNPMLCDNDNTA
ncbi:DUF3987 domain-containing protein [Bartonella sp. B35(2025)]